MENRDVLIDRMTENLPVFRKMLKLSQESLAQIIGSSRYTVMLIETGKRRMTWNTFLSLILLFEKNDTTATLLRAMDIYTPELDEMLTLKKLPKESDKNRVREDMDISH